MLRKITCWLSLFCFFIILLAGCTGLTHVRELMVLERIGENQAEIKEYLDEQERLFYKLRQDIENNQLSQGMPLPEVLSMYGEPIFQSFPEEQGKIKRTYFYRHPTQYFSSDRIYLNFDDEQRLCSWKLEKSSCE